MNLYEIALPKSTNNGASYLAERGAWEALALTRCGGFTRFDPALGLWRSPEGQVFADSMVPYRVACAPEQMRLLVADAFRLFPDQLAFFVSQIGTAEIVSRGETYGYGK